RAVREGRLDQGGRLGADRARPVDEARRRPLQMALVRLRHVGRVGGVLPADDTPPMRGDALAAVEDLDGGRGQAGVDVFMNERVGDGVVMAVKLEVVVEADASADLPVAVDEGLGGEWPKCGLVQVDAVVEELKKLSKSTKDKKEIAQVATIAANNDKTIGDLIAEAHGEGRKGWR